MLMVSLPLPPLIVSVPVPAVITSLFVPPMIELPVPFSAVTVSTPSALVPSRFSKFE